MSDDLVKRLRETTHMYQVDCELKMRCADRIEELEAACWRMKEERDRAIGWRDSDKDRADAAEAKLSESEALLAKAVEALETIAFECVGDEAVYTARTTLKELKGETNE